MPSPTPDHYRDVAKVLRLGKVVPFLGAGVNLCDRPEAITGETWEQAGYLPRGGELAQYLADEFGLPAGENRNDLMRVSQYVSITIGPLGLYESLQSLLKRDYAPTRVHRFFARLCRSLQDQQPAVPAHPVLLTTNYDRVMERALQDEGVEYDVVYYAVVRDQLPGAFWHLPHAEKHYLPQPGVEPEWVPIRDTQKYLDLPIGHRPIVVKIHGAVDCHDVEKCSFVISEDDYIDYMTRMDFAAPLPKQLMSHLRRSRFLFLGYGLRDWNLRVILQRLWSGQTLGVQSWAIDRVVSELDEKSWRKWRVDLLEAHLEDYIEKLGTAAGINVALPPAQPQDSITSSLS